MKSSFQILAIVVASVGLFGCGRQAADSEPSSTPDNELAGVSSKDGDVEVSLGTVPRQHLDDSSLPAGLTRETPPDQIVSAFLGALQRGDSGVAKALLTRRAREETQKRDLTVQQVGSPHATFKVGVPQYLTDKKTGVHVSTTWSEKEGAEVITYEIVWALRRQESGWRVAGMGAELGPGKPMVYLNFEDPDDMLSKWQQADNDAVAAGIPPDSEYRRAQTRPATGTSQR